MARLCEIDRLGTFSERQCSVGTASGLAGPRLDPVECADPLRPCDASLVSDWDCGRSLDAALAES